MKKGLRLSGSLFLFLFLSSSLFAQKAFIPDYSSDQLQVVNTATQAITAAITIQTGSNSIAVSQDGSRAYVGYYDDGTNSNIITVVDGNTNSVARDIYVNNDVPYVAGIAISPDGSQVFFANNDTLFAINTQSLLVVARTGLAAGEAINGVAVSPDGTMVYAAGQNGIYVVDAATYTLQKFIPLDNKTLAQLIVSPDGKTLFTNDLNYGGLLYINVTTGATTAYDSASATYYGSVAVSPDGKKLYATAYGLNALHVIDVNTNLLTASVGINDLYYGVSISGDGQHVYAIGDDGSSLVTVSTATNTITSTLTTGGDCELVGGFVGGSTALPVNLLGFSVSPSGNDAKLQWQTASETNTSYFAIQRSADGINFTTIGKLAASGNSAIAKSYAYTDLNAAAINTKTLYYRLQVVDVNGRISLSDIKSVTPAVTSIVLLLPNPVKNLLTLQVSRYSGKAELSVTDMSGRRMLTQNRMVQPGDNILLNVSALQPGIYILRAEGENLSVEQKFIKQ